ncbi:MAG: LacI family transcriptional regulator [Chloroflexi bacterium]|nr:LacI family transcriptional regulator [Chloroflexota bacterium]
MPRMTTIRDVAKRAGVSIATVSRVMNGSTFVSEPLQERVWQAIRELNYSPSALAQGLSTHVSRTIGVIVPSITKHPFWAQVVAGIEDACRGEGYNLFLCHSDANVQRERDYLQLLRTRRVDGVIIGPATETSEHLQGILSEDWPVVAVDGHFVDRAIPCITVDNYHAAYAATAYLTSLGHRRIGVLSGPASHSVSMERLRGYRDALSAVGAPVRPDLERICPFDDEAARQAIHQFFAAPEPPTALFCLIGRWARVVLAALRQQGKAIPDGVSLLTFDDLEWMALVSPPLTAIAQPAVEMGRQAIGMLFGILRQTEPAAPTQVVLETTFAPRASCAPPAEPSIGAGGAL